MMTGPSMWLWWFARRSPARRDRCRCSRPSTRIHANTRASGRIQVGRLHAADRARRPRSVPRREVDRLGRRRVARRRALDERAQLRRRRAPRRTRLRRCASETRPRAPPSARRARASSGPAPRASSPATDRRGRRTSRPAPRARRRPPRPARGAAAARHPVADRRALQLPRAFGARQLGLGPDQRAADLLMIGELRVRLRGRPRRRRRPGRARAPRARAPRVPMRHADDRRVAHAGDAGSARARRLPERRSALRASRSFPSCGRG